MKALVNSNTFGSSSVYNLCTVLEISEGANTIAPFRDKKTQWNYGCISLSTSFWESSVQYCFPNFSVFWGIDDKIFWFLASKNPLLRNRGGHN